MAFGVRSPGVSHLAIDVPMSMIQFRKLVPSLPLPSLTKGKATRLDTTRINSSQSFSVFF